MTTNAAGNVTIVAPNPVNAGNGYANTIGAATANANIWWTVNSVAPPQALSPPVVTGDHPQWTTNVAGPGGSVLRITAPTVTSSTNSLANNATQLIIKGANFDAVTAGNNIVQFTTLNVTGTVSAVNAAGTQLTVTINTLPSGNGPLMAIVSFGTNPTINSGAAVQVATVVDPPKVFGSTQDMAINAPTLVITGSGFSTTPANNTLVFDQGAFGTVTAVNGAGTQLTVSFVPPPAANKAPTTLGPMTVIVTANGSNSGPATQVANIVKAPVVNAVTDDMASNAPTLIIQGSNFSTTPSKNTVVFTSGAVGTVTAVNPGGTQLTVSFVPPPATNKAPDEPGCHESRGHLQ